MFDIREKYNLKDVGRQIDRDKTTLIRWADQGLIPPAQRDSRGWRYYSQAEAKKIVKLVVNTDYFTKIKNKKKNKNYEN